MKMIANVEFRTHPLIQPDTFVLCNMEHFMLVEQNKILCFVHSDKEVISIMKDPTDFIKHINKMKAEGSLPSL